MEETSDLEVFAFPRISHFFQNMYLHNNELSTLLFQSCAKGIFQHWINIRYLHISIYLLLNLAREIIKSVLDQLLLLSIFVCVVHTKFRWRKDNIFARNENIGKICKRTITWMDFNNRIAEGTIFATLILRGPESAASSIKLFN